MAEFEDNGNARKLGRTSVVRSSGQTQPVVRRKAATNKTANEKKIAEDEFMAAAIGDVEWLRQSLRGSKGKINYDKNGLAALHLAAIHGRLDCLKLIIEKMKVDVNLASTTGWRAIHLCISNQTGKRAFNCMLYLLDQKADPSVENNDGITPMHQAASEGHVQCLKALMDAGAALDITDNRGHKPIDLAKLWGHRKCARILAAEQWHQDKDFLATEMSQLQKLKMQQVLKEIENDEENKVDQEFYGELAFKEWLRQRGLEPRPTGPPSAELANAVAREEEKERGRVAQEHAANKESLHRANSFQKKQPSSMLVEKPSPIQEEPRQPIPKAVPQKPEKPVKNKKQPARVKTRESDRMPVSRGSDTNIGLYEQPAQVAEEPTNEDVPLHMSSWNKSTKTPKKDYITILEDDYPRDEFTMLPKHGNKRLSRSPTLIMADDQMKGGHGNSQMPQLPKDVIAKALEPGKYERPVNYKCKHIFDIHKKKMLDAELLPKPEIGMHMTSDTGSKLFKSALVKGLPLTPISPSRTSTISSDTTIDIPAVADFMRKLNKKGVCQTIQGKEWGQIQSV